MKRLFVARDQREATVIEDLLRDVDIASEIRGGVPAPCLRKTFRRFLQFGSVRKTAKKPWNLLRGIFEEHWKVEQHCDSI